MNVTFESDADLSLAFRIRTNKADAKKWIEENITFGGAAPVINDSSDTWLIISLKDIPISNIKTPYALVVAGQTYYVSVYDYIIKAQGTDNVYLQNLTKALAAYYDALGALTNA